MTTIGTTTATAILPPCDKPPDCAALSAPLVANGAAPEEDGDDAEDERSVSPGEGWESDVVVEVMTTTEGAPVPPVDAGLSVITEVMRTTELGGRTEEVGGGELLGIMEEELDDGSEVTGVDKAD